jgi:hypothetical protein
VSAAGGGYGDERAVASTLRRLKGRRWNVLEGLGDVGGLFFFGGLGRFVVASLWFWLFYLRLPVSFLPLYVIWGMCGWAQTIGSIGEAGGGFLLFCFCLGGRQKAWDSREEARQVMYKPMKYGNPPPKRPPHDSATTTQLRVESFTAFDSPRRITHLAHSNYLRRCCGCRIFDASSF